MTTDFIPREGLSDRFEAGFKLPLSVISASAGYGKSTLLSYWLDACDLPSAWLSLDESDNDVRIFLSYFVAAIRTVSNSACKETLNILNTETLPPLPIVTTHLSNDLDALESRLVLVLDDYHRIRDPAIHALIDRLLEYPPRGLHLAIATRRDPALSLDTLRARNLLNEIRLQDLRFSRTETHAFFRQMIGHPVEAPVISRLQEITEGWPVGIRLAALALRHQDDADDFLSHFGTATRLLQDYLVGEVLSAQPPMIRDCLLNTSILDRFNASLCEAVYSQEVGGNDHPTRGKNFIEILEKSGLFCVALDGRGEWFRFHHLFGNLLHKQLEETRSRDEIAGIHQAASRWLAENGHFEEAIQHALAGDDVQGAIGVIGSSRQDLMNSDQWHRLERWLNLFTHEAVQQNPHLLLLRCWLDVYHWYRLDYLVKDMDRAEVLLDEADLDASERVLLKAEVASIRSMFAYWVLEPSESLALAKQVIRDSPDSQECIRSSALWSWSALCQMLGDVPQAEQVIWRHMEHGRFNRPSSRARLMLPLCMTYWPEADTQKLMKAASGLLDCSLEHELSWSQAFARYYLGLIHYERNELNDAVAQLKIIVEDPYLYPIQNVTHCAFLLSLSYQGLGLPDRAREVADSIAKLTFERGNMMFVGLSEAFKADLDLRQGQIVQAEHWGQGFILPAPHALQRFYNAELTAIRVLIALGTPRSRAAAIEQLDSFHQLVMKIHHKRLLIDVLGMKALLADAEGNTETAVALLSDAVALGQPGNLIRPLADVGPGLIKLLNRLDPAPKSLQYVGKILSALNDLNQTSSVQLENPPLPEPLSDRELEILDLFAKRLSNKEIANQLFIASGTVKRHAHNIYSKLAVSGRHDAVTKAISLGILNQ